MLLSLKHSLPWQQMQKCRYAASSPALLLPALKGPNRSRVCLRAATHGRASSGGRESTAHISGVSRNGRFRVGWQIGITAFPDLFPSPGAVGHPGYFLLQCPGMLGMWEILTFPALSLGDFWWWQRTGWKHSLATMQAQETTARWFQPSYF